MIIDCITFFNEIDMLKLRMAILAPYVDKFVIIEADHTHSGHPKPAVFEIWRHRFNGYEDKIIYKFIHLEPHNEKDDIEYTEYSPDSMSWQRENAQRNAFLTVLKDFPEDAFILIGDLDEVPNPEAIEQAVDLLKRNHDPWFVLAMLFFYYHFGNRNVTNGPLWYGTVITKNIWNGGLTPQYLRNHRGAMRHIVNGGWHWSYFGDKTAISQKLKAFAHTEYSKPEYTSEQVIEEKLLKGQGVCDPNASFTEYPLNNYPPDILRMILHYSTVNLTITV